MAEVRLHKIRKVFDNKVTAVENLELTVDDHDFLVLVGPSGCGKSTTLRLVAGLEEATEGEIYIGDRNVTRLPPKDRDIAMVFQSYALYPHMTVYQNLAFGLKMKKLPESEIEKKVAGAAKILDIEDLLARKPKALSGGQRQRVALGRAIVREAKVFLFDEPLSNLDAKLRVQMRAEIAKLHNRLRTTTIYVTHDQVEAMTMGRRIVVMKDGRIQQADTPLHLYNAPVNIFVAGFIGSPAMNFISGSIVQENGLRFVSDGITLITAGSAAQAAALARYREKPVVIGIRPEDVYPVYNSEQKISQDLINATVDFVEPMGNETLLSCSAGGSTLTVRTEPSCPVRMGDTVSLRVEMTKAHFFDSGSEERIKTHEP